MWIEWSNGLINLDYVNRIYLDQNENCALVYLKMSNGEKYLEYFETLTEAKYFYEKIKEKICPTFFQKPRC